MATHSTHISWKEGNQNGDKYDQWCMQMQTLWAVAQLIGEGIEIRTWNEVEWSRAVSRISVQGYVWSDYVTDMIVVRVGWMKGERIA